VNTSTQLKALIRNLSKSNNINSQIILRNYMLERLLERISISNYSENIILKGGFLIAAMVGIDSRSTMDIDTTIKGQILTKDNVTKLFEEILFLPVDDNVKMTLKTVEDIRDESDYPGLRLSIETILDKTKQILKLMLQLEMLSLLERLATVLN
jgi:predicted nucleotidyltransferase component of viral defense system